MGVVTVEVGAEGYPHISGVTQEAYNMHVTALGVNLVNFPELSKRLSAAQYHK